jgi:hypothetical protein
VRGQAHDSAVRFTLPAPVRVSHIAVVTTLACGLDVPQDFEVASVTPLREDTPGHPQALVAGRHTGEWSVGCVAKPAEAAHGLADVFDSSPAPGGGTGCMGHHFLGDFKMEPAPATGLTISWSRQRFPHAAMHLKHVTVFDHTGRAIPLGASNMRFSEGDRWQRRDLTPEEAVMENKRAMSRAWFVGEIVMAPSEAAELVAIHSGKLPNGRPFDPRRVAISSDARAPSLVPAIGVSEARAGVVTVESWPGATKSFTVESSVPGVLVVSNRFYPGWTARVDGAESPLIRVDGVLQGVPLPAGKHRVTLDFLLSHFRLLVAIALLAALVAIGLFVRRDGRESAFFKRPKA